MPGDALWPGGMGCVLRSRGIQRRARQPRLCAGILDPREGSTAMPRVTAIGLLPAGAKPEVPRQAQPEGRRRARCPTLRRFGSARSSATIRHEVCIACDLNRACARPTGAAPDNPQPGSLQRPRSQFPAFRSLAPVRTELFLCRLSGLLLGPPPFLSGGNARASIRAQYPLLTGPIAKRSCGDPGSACALQQGANLLEAADLVIDCGN
jgi:hypothetical protein